MTFRKLNNYVLATYMVVWNGWALIQDTYSALADRPIYSFLDNIGEPFLFAYAVVSSTLALIAYERLQPKTWRLALGMQISFWVVMFISFLVLSPLSTAPMTYLFVVATYCIKYYYGLSHIYMVKRQLVSRGA